MTDLVVSQIAVQSNLDGSAFRLVCSNDDGEQSTPLLFDAHTLGNTLSDIIGSASEVATEELSPDAEFPVRDGTPRAKAISIEPVEGEPTLARLTLVCGSIDLQFLLPVTMLFLALSDLQNRVEWQADSRALN